MAKVVEKKFKDMNPAEKARHLQKKKERDSELVSGIFQNLETRGGGLYFSIALYPGDEFKSYELRDGERYRIPRGVARHLSTDCYHLEYKHLQGHSGQVGMRAAANDGRLHADKMQAKRKVPRFAFNSLSFDDDDLDMNMADITEVTVSP